MHTRQAIREAVLDRLTGLATTGSNVFMSRVYPMSRNTLPGMAIFAISESTLYATSSLPRTQQRNLNITVEIYVKGVDGYDDQIDKIASEVESALYEDVTLDGLVLDTKVMSIEVNFSDGAEQPVGAAAMTLDILYVTKEGGTEIN